MSTENIEQQVRLYGQPLSERFGAIVQAYGITQRRLAEVLGLSAPMLSQLNSGRRIKIGNPAVYERLVMLEQRIGTPEVEETLAEVEASQPVLSTTQIQAGIHSETNTVAALATVVPLRELEVAVDLLGEGAPTLTKVVRLAVREAEQRQAATAREDARG
ncbi:MULTISPECIES: DNA-binding protein [Kocuria]|uniref:DNA-binding protein n=1 Tax=Kocuria TaxID=57493 RepID=UPI0020419B5A|nr:MULTISPECIES: DNA-binding protein [Kocuria]MCM3688036.1 DNA-binding protein [Kocuria rosea]HST73679.1 DNA-binding protein [Kocuria rosea]